MKRLISSVLAVFVIAGAIVTGGASLAKEPILLAQATGKSARQGESPPANPPQANWIVNCTGTGASNAMRCELFQQVVIKETNQRLMRMSILPQPNSDNDLISFAVPHGLMLQRPLRVQVDDNPVIELPYTHSDNSSVYANAVLKPEWLSSFKRGNELKISFDTIEGKTITVKLSLQGFTAASDKYASF